MYERLKGVYSWHLEYFTELNVLNVKNIYNAFKYFLTFTHL